MAPVRVHRGFLALQRNDRCIHKLCPARTVVAIETEIGETAERFFIFTACLPGIATNPTVRILGACTNTRGTGMRCTSLDLDTGHVIGLPVGI